MGTDSADPQYASLGEFCTAQEALAAANLIAAEAEAEDPHVIFSIPGGEATQAASWDASTERRG